MTDSTMEKVSQVEMMRQFKERYAKCIEENKALSAKIRENEATALKLQGALEALESITIHQKWMKSLQQKLKQKLREHKFPSFLSINNLEACYS